MSRKKTFSRKTKETEINIEFCVDGNGKSSINSGNGFMDHMLTLFTKHGMFDLNLECIGDTEVDFHHSIEDIGISLGKCLADILGDHSGINRFGTSFVPMDESLARVIIDLGGRPNLAYSVPVTDRKINNFECDLVEDFFKAFSNNARVTLHVDLLRGRNSHHSIEAVFKSFAKALSEACMINPGLSGAIPSTKGLI